MCDDALVRKLLADNQRLQQELTWAQERLEAEGLVYFLERDSLVKIGHTQNIVRRCADHRKQGPFRLRGLEVGGRAHEALLHGRFEHLAVHGEWFREGPDLSAYIQALRFLPPKNAWQRRVYERHGYL